MKNNKSQSESELSRTPEVYIEPAIHTQLKVLAAIRRQTMGEVFKEAWERYVQGLPVEERRLLQLQEALSQSQSQSQSHPQEERKEG